MKKIIQSKIFHNFSWLFADKLIRLVLSLFVSVVVARYLGPEKYGLWNYLLSITFFFLAFTSLGLENILPRELIKHPEKEKALMNISFSLKILGAVLGFILNIVLFFFLKNPNEELLLMASLMASLLLFQSFDILDIFYKTRLQAKYVVIGRNIAFIIVALLKLVFVYFDFPLLYFVGTNALETFLGGLLVLSIFYKQGFSFSFLNLDWKLGFSLLKDSFPLAISGLMVMLYLRLDQVMLTELDGEKANGIYSTGVRMIEIVYFIPVALADSFYPGIIYSKKHEGEKYEKNLIGFYSIMSYTAIFITISTLIIAKPMMALLFGDQYEGSGQVLQVFALSLYGTFLGVATGKYLSNENFQKIILSRSAMGLILNIILNFIWIPKYGFMGAAYASLVSYFIPLLMLLPFKSSRAQFFLIISAINPSHLKNKLKQ